MIDSFMQDVRYALRAMKANPAFTLVAVLSLALGIGANTAIFSLLDAVILKYLPVRHPEELLRANVGKDGGISNPLWEALRERQGDRKHHYHGQKDGQAAGKVLQRNAREAMCNERQRSQRAQHGPITDRD